MKIPLVYRLFPAIFLPYDTSFYGIFGRVFFASMGGEGGQNCCQCSKLSQILSSPLNCDMRCHSCDTPPCSETHRVREHGIWPTNSFMRVLLKMHTGMHQRAKTGEKLNPQSCLHAKVAPTIALKHLRNPMDHRGKSSPTSVTPKRSLVELKL